MNSGTEKQKKDFHGALEMSGEILEFLSTKDGLHLREDALLLSVASLVIDKNHESEDADAVAVFVSHLGTMRELKKIYRKFNIQEI